MMKRKRSVLLLVLIAVCMLAFSACTPEDPADNAEKTISYTVETYRQNEDLTYDKTGSETFSAEPGSVVEAEYEPAEEGYYVDTELSVLSATLTEETVLSVYYSLNHACVSVERVNGDLTEYRVYGNGIVADSEGERVEDFEALFTLTADEPGKYYFWDIDGTKAKRALTAEDFRGLEDGTSIVEKYSRDTLFNTAKFNNAVRLNGDGTYTVTPTDQWSTDTAAYLFFTESSDTLYAKVKITAAADQADISAGFVLVDSGNMDKNAQFYLGCSGGDRILWQNNSFNWGDGTNRRVYQDSAAAVAPRENVFEVAVSDGIIRFWLNGRYFCEEELSVLTGPGNVAGMFSGTQSFDLGIAQWRFNKPETVFSEVEFLYGDAAAQKIVSRMLTLDKSETVIDVSDPSSMQLLAQTAEGMGPVTWTSSDESIVKVADGALTPVGGGVATVTAEATMDGRTYAASCTVTVDLWTVSFVAQNETVKTISVFNGGSVNSADIPEIRFGDPYIFAEWDKTAEDLRSIRSDVTATAIYYAYQYEVTYYRQNAKTGEYQSYDQTMHYAQNANVDIAPQSYGNYRVNDERSVLHGTAVQDETLQLSVYYDLVVRSVEVSVELGSEQKIYTAYYGLGLYDGENKVDDYSFFRLEGYVWEVNGKLNKADLNEAYFSDLTEELTIVRHAGSTEFGSDMRGATVNDDGSVDTVSSGWTGAHAYFTGSGTSFYVQTTLRSREQMNGGEADQDISAGFTVRGSDGSSFQIYLSFAYNSIRINYGHLWSGGDGEFGDASAGSWIVSTPIPSESFVSGKGAVVGLSYDEGMFRLYVDGQMIFEFSASDLNFVQGSVSMGTGWSVGLASWDTHKANFSDFYVVYEKDTVLPVE